MFLANQIAALKFASASTSKSGNLLALTIDDVLAMYMRNVAI